MRTVGYDRRVCITSVTRVGEILVMPPIGVVKSVHKHSPDLSGPRPNLSRGERRGTGLPGGEGYAAMQMTRQGRLKGITRRDALAHDDASMTTTCKSSTSEPI